MTQPIGSIYVIRNLVNQKVYVGLTKQTVATRWKQHVYQALGRGSPTALAQAIREYGEDSFFVFELVRHPYEDLAESERFFIASFKSNDPEFGYNLNGGGATGGMAAGTPVTYDGVTYSCRTDACAALGVSYFAVRQRMNREGMSFEEAVALPLADRKRPVVVNGIRYSTTIEACQALGVDVELIRSRLKLGWSISRAFGTRTLNHIEFANSIGPELVRLRESGLTFDAVAENLNANGVATYRGTGKWSDTQVRRTLKTFRGFA